MVNIDDSDDEISSEGSACDTDNDSDSTNNSDSEIEVDGEYHSSSDDDDMPLDKRWEKFSKPFQWKENVNFEPDVHAFADDKVGLQTEHGFTTETKVLEIFEYFISSEVGAMICNASNSYHADILKFRKDSGKLKPNSRISKWKGLESDELYVYFALRIIMSIVKKSNIRMYWTTDPLLATPVFQEYMSVKRFELIHRYLRYCYDDGDETEKLRKVKPFFEMINEKFKKLFRPGENISVDESLLKFKGRLSIRQCKLSKRARFDIKLYKCCDSETGYIYDLSIYEGKDDSKANKIIGISGKVVLQMIGDLSKQGRTIFIDNWYSSPALFDKLHKHKNNVIGTVRTNRKHMPMVPAKFFTKMKRNEIITFSSHIMVVLFWKDKKLVSMISTSKTADLINTEKIIRKTGENISKPQAVAEYNKHMNGVDKGDQIVHPYEVLRKTMRWYQKIADNTLDMIIFNSNVVYNILHPSKKEKLAHLDYRITLAREILEKYGKKKEKKITKTCNFMGNAQANKNTKAWG